MQIVFCRKVRGMPNPRRRDDSVGGSFRLLLPERRRAPWRWPRSGGRTGLAPISRSARIPRPPGRGDRRRAGPSPAPARQALLRRSPAGGRSREGVPIPERRRGKRVAASPQSPCGPLFPGLSPRLGTSGPGCAYRDRSLQLGPLFRPVHSDDVVGIADKHRPLRQPVEFGHGLLGNELHDGSLTDHFHLGAGLDHLIENPVYICTELVRGDSHDSSISYVRLLILVRTCTGGAGADGLEIARRSQNRTGPRRVQRIKSGSGAFPDLPRESEYNEFKAPEFSPPMSSRWKYLVVSTSTCLTLLFLIGSVLGQGASTQEDTLKHIGVFSEVVARIQREYVEEPDMRSVSLGALNGMLEAIDPFASYLNADQYRDYLKNKDVKRSDVGLIL